MYIIIIGCGKVGLSLAEQLERVKTRTLPSWILLLTELQNLSDDLRCHESSGKRRQRQYPSGCGY